MYVEINQNTVETPLKDTAWGWAHPSLWHFCNRKSFDNADGQLRVKSTASQNFNDVVVEFTFCLALYPDFSVILHTVFSPDPSNPVSDLTQLKTQGNLECN